MLKSNKLTSESGLTSQRPTSRVDTSIPNRSLHLQISHEQKPAWIKIRKVREDNTQGNPYLNVEKHRNVHSMHTRPSFTRKNSSDQKNQVDYEEIKQFINEVDGNYKDEIPFSRFQKPLRIEYSRQDKRMNHLNMIVDTYRDRISSRNIQNDIDAQQKFRNKIKIRSQEFALIKQKSNDQIGKKIRTLKLDSERPQQLYRNYLKSFRAQSDYILSQMPFLSSQQITTLANDLQNYENFKLASDRTVFKEPPLKNQAESKNILHRNNNYPIQNDVDNQLSLDESVISETEAKLNQLYGQSIQLQKYLMQVKKTNPVKVINSIRKVDQIKMMIDKVNQQKLMNKFNI